MLVVYGFFFSSYDDHRDLHSFPTRRSSDLLRSLGTASMASCGTRRRRLRTRRRTLFRHIEERLELVAADRDPGRAQIVEDRKSTRLNSSHSQISYAVFCLKKKRENSAGVCS